MDYKPKIETLKIKGIFKNEKGIMDGAILSFEMEKYNKSFTYVELINASFNESMEDIKLYLLDMESLKRRGIDHLILQEETERRIRENRIRILSGYFPIIQQEKELIDLILEE